MQAADHLEVQPGAHQPVDRGLLRGDADAAAHRAGLVNHVEARHRGAALGGLAQRGEDADGRGLAGAVVAEQPEHGAGRNVEVEVAQRPQSPNRLPRPVAVTPPAWSLRWVVHGRLVDGFSYGVPMFRT